ncbi:cell wall hydrolase [Aneurinibacillus terranovensis]|uniref:cell wall hydrolase n=1 Tax=Aneurinibacillus terranovensis TaxID=278991 RepID=UPI000403090C|nr:cell wall hydrolase [Aneurinibacillus terranovensis]
MSKKYAAVLMTVLLLVLMLPGMSFADSTSSASVTIDGKPLQTQSFVQGNTVMVPAVLFINTGTVVGWSTKYQAVTFQRNGMIIAMPSGKKYADVYTNKTGTWTRDYVSTTTTDRRDGTYVPMRYVAEKLGMKVTYNSASQTGSVQTKTAAVPKDDNVYWLYQLTEAEAGGESHAGKVAVAASVLNRVKSPDWPKTIKGVIFQVYHINGTDYYQYSTVQDKRIYNVTPSADTIAAVNDALQGSDPSNHAVIFYNPSQTSNQWVRSHAVTATIGHHVFAK